MQKYVLTYEMKILYCPDIEMNLSCKELNLSTLQFRLYAGNRSDLFAGFELSAEDVTSVARDILMGKIGYELAEKQMTWLQKFEELLKKDISLILNKDISYNYFVLKLQLLGFEEQMAKDIVYHYYKQLEQKQEVAHPQVFLKKINTLLRQKAFWVKKDLWKEMDAETTFFQGVIGTKLEQQYKFSFDKMYKDDYIEVLKTGIIHTLLLYNLTPSYLVRKKQAVTDLVPYVLSVYKYYMRNILNNICINTFHITPNKGFIDDLLYQMEMIVRVYVAIYFK